MAFETTVTEYEIDVTSLQFAQGMRGNGQELEPDLAVDGLSESILSRLVRLLGLG